MLNVKDPEKPPKVDGGWVSDGKSHIGDEDKQVQTWSKAAKNSREVMGTPDGQEQTNAKDPEKPSKIDSGSWEQQTSTTLKVFWLGETEGVRTLTNIAGIWPCQEIM